MTWIYFVGKEGSAFERVAEYNDIFISKDEPELLTSWLSAHSDVHDLSWQTDDGYTHILKRKKDGETITAPR